MMNETKAWEQFRPWVHKIALSLHYSYPNHLEKEEKISIAYIAFSSAVKSYKHGLSETRNETNRFMEYSKIAIQNLILNEIYKEMRAHTPQAQTRGPNPKRYGMVYNFAFEDDSEDQRELQISLFEAGGFHSNDPTNRIHFDKTVKGMLQGMNRETQKIFRRHFLKGMTFTEIGKELGITKQAARQRMHRFLLKNRALMRDQG
ncbi:MAG: sigma-70 family RNA polymerase sigma factor [Candidatus Thorarchaeota archaeon]|jgi:RNA polymerase sigma factor (sigma-70 family)